MSATNTKEPCEATSGRFSQRAVAGVSKRGQAALCEAPYGPFRQRSQTRFETEIKAPGLDSSGRNRANEATVGEVAEIA